VRYISIGAASGAVLGVLIVASDASEHPTEGVLVMAAFIIPIFAIIGMLVGWFCLTLRSSRRNRTSVDREDMRPLKPKSPGLAVSMAGVGGLIGAAIMVNRLAAIESTGSGYGYLVGAFVGWVIGSLAQIVFLFRKHEKDVRKWKSDTEQWERRQESYERNKDRGLTM
jgi:heme/copper-type cytochrome/quinol oxidase subunit 2